ncbi:cytochrome P450 [Lophiostoma macrostomum CBS 122681]|uniref:Cytochrome P450 n=1 Tax=Lophiostoma macrostomum CBS 122681 TaxID=1314788 RepID=A0A6A6SSE4_9PLEO|nr:cytochrome P450 [Lophiostoma macrostomum CBS 122681]
MDVFSFPALAGLVFATASLLLLLRSRKSRIPRIGPKPGFLGNTTKSYFFQHSQEMIEEGYAKRFLYKDGLYSLWTTDMDRVVVSHKFMKDFMPLPRSTVRLTASRRHAGPYTGLDIAEESSLQFEVCAGQLSQSIGTLARPVLDEISYCMNEKLRTVNKTGDSYALAVFPLMIELVTSGVARVFVGPELCPKVTSDLQAHYRIFHPLVAPFLESYRSIKSRFSLARQLLTPLIEERRLSNDGKYQDMMQWLIDSAKGKDAETDRLVRRMLFLNMAAIHTTAEVSAIVLMELCHRPECIVMIREEIREATNNGRDISLASLKKLKKTDSFIRESHRLDPLGFMTFNRHLAAPVKLSNGTLLPGNTYISMAHYPAQRDPEYYPDPLTFDALRFYNLRQKEGQAERHQFTAVGPDVFNWGVGKFACPGRFWASANIKLILVELLLKYDLGFPQGETKPERVVAGEKLRTSFTQRIVFKPMARG